MRSRSYPHTLFLFTDENPVAEYRNGVCIYALYHINKYCINHQYALNGFMSKILIPTCLKVAPNNGANKHVIAYGIYALTTRFCQKSVSPFFL